MLLMLVPIHRRKKQDRSSLDSILALNIDFNAIGYGVFPLELWFDFANEEFLSCRWDGYSGSYLADNSYEPVSLLPSNYVVAWDMTAPMLFGLEGYSLAAIQYMTCDDFTNSTPAFFGLQGYVP